MATKRVDEVRFFDGRHGFALQINYFMSDMYDERDTVQVVFCTNDVQIAVPHIYDLFDIAMSCGIALGAAVRDRAVDFATVLVSGFGLPRLIVDTDAHVDICGCTGVGLAGPAHDGETLTFYCGLGAHLQICLDFSQRSLLIRCIDVPHAAGR